MNQNLDELYKKSPELFPKKVAVIMDGNRRWAKKRGLKEIEGHRAGVECIKPLVTRATQLGVKSITFWIWSTENFDRDKNFVKDIFTLAREYLISGKYFKEISEKGGKLKVVGDLSLFPKDITDYVLKYVKESNPKEYKIDVNIALGYGGRDELIRGMKKMIDDGVKPKDINADTFAKYLDYKEDLDLLIRTGGMVRTSGFMPWQSVYAEMYFTDILCPDFSAMEFDKAVLDFANRVRNFGR